MLHGCATSLCAPRSCAHAHRSASKNFSLQTRPFRTSVGDASDPSRSEDAMNSGYAVALVFKQDLGGRPVSRCSEWAPWPEEGQGGCLCVTGTRP